MSVEAIAEDPIHRNALLDRFLYDMAQADEGSIRSYEELILNIRADTTGQQQVASVLACGSANTTQQYLFIANNRGTNIHTC
jgi:hypothetical protein